MWVALARSDSSLQLAELPWPVALEQAKAVISADTMELEGLRGSVGDSAFAGVEAEFRRYLECGILAHGFARARRGGVRTRFSDCVFL